MQKSKKFIIEDKQGNNMYPATFADVVFTEDGGNVAEKLKQIEGATPNAHTHTKSQITDFAHTHTKSEISDFPTSLPASGGNADTIGGKRFNWEFGSTTPTHIWGSEGSATEQYVYQPSQVSVGHALNSDKVGNVVAQNIPVYLGSNPDLSILNNPAYNQNYDCWVHASNATSIGLPDGGNWHVSFKKHANTDGYGTQIAMPYGRNEMYMRSSEANSWRTWSKVGGGSSSFVLPHAQHTINLTTPGKEFHLPCREYYMGGSSKSPVSYFFSYYVPKVTGVARVQYEYKHIDKYNGKAMIFVGTFPKDVFTSSYDANIVGQLEFSTVAEGSKFQENINGMFFPEYIGRLRYDGRNTNYTTVESIISVREGVPIVIYGYNYEYDNETSENLDVYVRNFKLIYKEVK